MSDKSTSNNKKNSIGEQQSSSINADKFANVPFIDSEEKLTSNYHHHHHQPNDNDERTTVKNNFETNVSYSNAETIDKLKQEVSHFFEKKSYQINEEKQKLIDYVHKRIIGNATEKKLINEYLEAMFS